MNHSALIVLVVIGNGITTVSEDEDAMSRLR
jgi:hypothetical protein